MPFEDAWVLSAKQNIKSEESRKKLCPKRAFLGLCESGDLKTIKVTELSKNINYQYARFAINEWKNNPLLSSQEMWKKVRAHFNRAKNHQGQLDVAKALKDYWN